jgi:hypothetical protein
MSGDARPDQAPAARPAAVAVALTRSPSVFAAGRAALRRFWRPFLLIQSAAIALGLAYRASDTIRSACVVLARWKTAGGLPFAAIASAVAGGLLPELAKRLVGRGPAGDRWRVWRDLVFNGAFFAVNGLLVDGMYRTLARVVGNDARVSTIVAKVAFDQFVFTPIVMALATVLFLLRQRGWSWARTQPALGRGFVAARVMPLLVPCWCFWIPIVAIVYALPGPLQFLMFALALAAWSLILVFIANDRAADST